MLLLRVPAREYSLEAYADVLKESSFPRRVRCYPFCGWSHCHRFMPNEHNFNMDLVAEPCFS